MPTRTTKRPRKVGKAKRKRAPNHWGAPFLREYQPCPEARRWLRAQPSPGVAWARCDRSDWMVAMLVHLGLLAHAGGPNLDHRRCPACRLARAHPSTVRKHHHTNQVVAAWLRKYPKRPR